ncbi:hypothetical protein [Desulfobacula toluolica]|uniref:Uncharacterized protein n=1 Tax=Desulfobacula toluolica (strain DSM 7467 / Tol2) TaxID=651182 RepID=K0ND48_DESTT|nr:hypothetical protein [Desulfobacula toluolica]CCK78685.1 uncharacterized protein TOL2_C05170 [Desulfobacula toluolica Tol2]
MNNDVTVFTPYPFKLGQKIRIEGSRRSGDWEVIDLSETKVTLRCPISKKEVNWDRFCYFVEEKNMKWPSD